MSKSQKLRVYCKPNDKKRELLSAKETRDGTIILLPRVADNFERGFLNGGSKSYHFSVHPSKENPKGQCTIKGTMETLEGNKVETYHQTVTLRTGVPHLVFARLVPEMSSDRYTHKPRAKDQGIRLCNYNEKETTLFMSVSVTLKQDDPELIGRDQRVYEKIFTLGEFRFFANYTFFPAPASGKGDYITPLNLAPTIDGKKRSGMLTGLSIAPGTQEKSTTIEMIYYSFSKFKEFVLHNLIEAMGAAEKSGNGGQSSRDIKRMNRMLNGLREVDFGKHDDDYARRLLLSTFLQNDR